MSKADLRNIYKAKRQELSSEEISELSLQIANKSLELPIWDKEFYHLFMTISEQKEIQTEFILNILQGKDKTVVVPKSAASNILGTLITVS